MVPRSAALVHSGDAYDELHAAFVPVLRHVFGEVTLPRTGIVLDLGSGPGHKLPLLAEAYGPAVTLVALDCDRLALRTSRQFHTDSQLAKPTHAHPSVHLLGGDAHALPLPTACCAAVCCIAALNQFIEPRAALCEMRRVLRANGQLLIAAGTQAWAYITPWPPPLAAQLAAAYRQALAGGAAHVAVPDFADDLLTLVAAAGFTAATGRAFLLDGSAPALAELVLLDWRALRPLVAAQLANTALSACDAVAHERDLALCNLALVAEAVRG